MFLSAKKTLAFAIVAGAIALPGQGFAYTCFNPAICKAVCGSETCGSATEEKAKKNYKPVERFSSAEMKREIGAAPRDNAVPDVLQAILSAAEPSTAAGYTCFNPAICIAVCGQKTC